MTLIYQLYSCYSSSFNQVCYSLLQIYLIHQGNSKYQYSLSHFFYLSNLIYLNSNYNHQLSCKIHPMVCLKNLTYSITEPCFCQRGNFLTKMLRLRCREQLVYFLLIDFLCYLCLKSYLLAYQLDQDLFCIQKCLFSLLYQLVG